MMHFKVVDGLRFIAFLPIFFLHACGGDLLYTLTLASLDMFFLISGFVTAYGRIQDFYPLLNGTQSDEGIGRYTMRYMQKKAQIFYPWHIACFLWCLIIFFLDAKVAGFIPSTTAEWIWKIPLHLLLLQSWSCNPNVKFCFNGVTWFLSSLMFCYAVTPLILLLISRLLRTRGISLLFLMGGGALLLKSLPYIFEADLSLSHDFTVLYDKDVHSWPPLRLLDYSIGMFVGVMLRLKVVEIKSYYHIVHYILTALLLVSSVLFPGPLTLLLSVVWLSSLVLVPSIISRILSSNFMGLLGGLVMPVYLTHNLVLKTMRVMDISMAGLAHAVIVFVCCFLLAWVLTQVVKRGHIKRITRNHHPAK